MKAIVRIVLAICLCLPFGLVQAQPPPTQPSTPQTGPGFGQGLRRGRGFGTDPRIQMRSYVLTNTGESMPYAVFVSSKVTKEKPAPLIIALHGLGGNTTTLLRGNALDLAEAGGYILVGPMGYNSGGWYGIPARGGGRGPRGARGARGARGPQFAAQGGTVVTNDAQVRILSEIDVTNVLALIRKEFNVDDRRTYLMGHSMGGAGVFYLGVKYATNWAAIGAMAPAAFGLRPDVLVAITNMPVIVVQGDADTSVPVAGTRRWADELKQLNMVYEYKEIPGADHGSVIAAGMPEIFKFFGEHTKPASP